MFISSHLIFIGWFDEQFVYEAGYGLKGRIGITLPRRVAVLATAKRVSHELNLSLGKEVGFQVRHEKKVGNDCCLKFMTDGILLRELQVILLLFFSSDN